MNNDLDARPEAPVANTGRVAALVTAGIAAGIVVLGALGANASDIASSPSLETSPSISCPSDARVTIPHTAIEHVFGEGLSPSQIVNSYVQSQDTWTRAFANPLYTTERPLLGSTPSAVEVDVRDMALNRIGVFVVTMGDSGYYLSRSFECGAKKV
jgi:hypothetical protein